MGGLDGTELGVSVADLDGDVLGEDVGAMDGAGLKPTGNSVTSPLALIFMIRPHFIRSWMVTKYRTSKSAVGGGPDPA